MKYRVYTAILLFVAAFSFSGCAAATLLKGRYQTVQFTSEPSGASIYDEYGFNIGITPVQVPLKRKSVQQLTIKADGYYDTKIKMGRTFNTLAIPVLLLPVLLTPDAVFYTIFDVIGGGIFKKKPSAVHMILKKAEYSSIPNERIEIVDIERE